MSIRQFFERFFPDDAVDTAEDIHLPSTSAVETAKPENDCDPSVYFESISFDSGPIISLDPDDIVIIVGPNNAGKSRALRDLHVRVSESNSEVLCDGNLKKVGTVEDFTKFVQRFSQRRMSGTVAMRVGEGFEVPEYQLKSRWNEDLRSSGKLFCQLIGTEDRISSSNAQSAIAVLQEVPKHPIHRLVIDDALEQKLSGIFQASFGQELILHRGAGSQNPLLVGRNPDRFEGEDRVSASYLDRLTKSTVSLQKQGDGMRSFATVILHLLASETQSIFLLDEPEAFLHPPQARRLGEIIATERMRSSQLFVATHSPDILSGLLSAAPQKLRIIRIDRDQEGRTLSTELDRSRVQQIAADPIMKFSSVLNGLFHKRVIVCEADSDCLFYSTLLDQPEVNGGAHPDVLFLQVGGKDRMASLVRILRDLGVVVDVIADIDVIGSRDTFQKIVEALGGSISELLSDLQVVDNAVSNSHSWLSSPQMVEQIRAEIDKAPASGELPKNIRNAIERILKKLSPWSALKEAGSAALPKGVPIEAFTRLIEKASSFGLWVVPLGELEGFCPYSGLHGPGWVQEVFARFDPSEAPELESARKFVSKIWLREV